MRGVDRVGRFPQLDVVVVPGRHRRERRLDVHVPVDDVDPVGHQVGELAAAEIPEVAPLVEALRAERLIGRGAEPALPIELVHRDRRVVARRRVLIPVGLDEGDLAEAARSRSSCLPSTK